MVVSHISFRKPALVSIFIALILNPYTIVTIQLKKPVKVLDRVFA